MSSSIQGLGKEYLFHLLNGNRLNQFKDFKIENFPFSNLLSVALTLGVYLLTIYGIQKLMKDRKPFKMTAITFIHNLFLSLASSALLIVLVNEVYPHIYKNGLHHAVCAKSMFTPKLAALYYINYLFKFYELIDTVILALKKKPLTFLHVYHHCLTLLLCYTQIVGEATVQWIPIVANLFVHGFMYWYYAMTSIRVHTWWKKYLTTLQIAQFIVDVCFCVYAVSVYELHTLNLLEYSCNGTRTAGYFGTALLFSYLLLFVDFYKKSYRVTPATRPTPIAEKMK